MNKIIIGAAVGAGAGIIDVVPMLIQKLAWEANISAFVAWIVIGIFIATSNIRMNGLLKGLLIAFLVVLPVAVIIGCKEPVSLLPISIMTLVLGSLSGWIIEKLEKEKS